MWFWLGWEMSGWVSHSNHNFYSDRQKKNRYYSGNRSVNYIQPHKIYISIFNQHLYLKFIDSLSIDIFTQSVTISTIFTHQAKCWWLKMGELAGNNLLLLHVKSKWRKESIVNCLARLCLLVNTKCVDTTHTFQK